MRKLISILLLLFFANPIFATTPPTPKVETTLNINITETTRTNLKNAAKSFDLEIQKARKNNCKGENLEKDFCKKEFSTTKKLINEEITFSTPATEKDFEQIVAFYNELKNFKELQTEFEILNSKTKNDIITQIELLKTQINLTDLIEKLNKENKLLNTALNKNENDGKITTTKITQEQFEKINTKINNVKNLNLEQHTKEAIEIPTIPTPEKLKEEKSIDELKAILINLQTLQTKINKETEIADSNIAKLEGNEAINNALQKLKDAKKEQAELLSQLGKNKITINNGNDNAENTKLNNDFPTEAKDPTYQPNKVVKELTVQNLETETTNVEKANELLKKYIKSQLNDCKKILSELINPETVNENITLQQCLQDVKEKQELNKELAEKIKLQFNTLIDLINEISKQEIIIYAEYDQFDRDLNKSSGDLFDYKMLGYSNGGSLNNPSDDYITYKPSLDNGNIKHTSLNKLTYEKITQIDINTILSNKELLNWNDYITHVIAQARTNISNMKNYIKTKKNECNLDNFAWNDEDKLPNGKDLATEVEMCMNTLRSNKCRDYATAIINIYNTSFNTPVNTSNECNAINEDAFCKEYAQINNVSEFISTIKKGEDNKNYSRKCKEYVDAEKSKKDLINRLNNACTENLPTGDDIKLLLNIKKTYQEMLNKECPSHKYGISNTPLSSAFQEFISNILSRFKIPAHEGTKEIKTCKSLPLMASLFIREFDNIDSQNETEIEKFINKNININTTYQIKCRK